jgi:hypothetical protein
MVELEVKPESLAAAAGAIGAALRTGEISRPPAPADGAAYGHPCLGAAVAEFGSAIRQATGLLVVAAERASAGLRVGAREYTACDQANLVELMGIRPGSS